MRHQQLIEGRDAPLWHGVAHYHSINQLNQNFIEGTTTQRFWPDGRRLKDNHPDYRDSFWLKGVSLTRDIKYAQGWGDIVYEIDQRALSQRYKIMPFNWGYSGHGIRNQHHKREREEFVILGRIYKSMTQFIEDHNDNIDAMWEQRDAALEDGNQELAAKITADIRKIPDAMDSWTGPTTSKIEPLDQYLISIRADEIHKTLDAKDINIILDHPKFKGYF